jgi:GNAT superfamily N-acetyltransferase
MLLKEFFNSAKKILGTQFMITLKKIDFDKNVAFHVNLQLRSDVKRAFPIFFHPAFQRSIFGVSQIVEEAMQKGFILSLRPFGEFRAFGLLETALLVFPEFQRQGIGKAAVSLLNSECIPRFFVSATSNKASTSFFNKQSELTLTHQNNRYKIFKTAA